MAAPKSYSNFAEFEREEIRPEQKCGWSIDDLFRDAELRVGESFYEDSEPDELDFGR